MKVTYKSTLTTTEITPEADAILARDSPLRAAPLVEYALDVREKDYCCTEVSAVLDNATVVKEDGEVVLLLRQDYFSTLLRFCPACGQPLDLVEGQRVQRRITVSTTVVLVENVRETAAGADVRRRRVFSRGPPQACVDKRTLLAHNGV